jgi:hypothetical protein
MASLRVTSGPLAGQTIDVTGELVIGRQDADITIDDAEISRRHAVVRRIPGALEVEDLGSANGTFVDGERIAGATRVGGGAKIRLGATMLDVEGVVPVQPTRVRPIVDPQATRATGIPADLTRARAVPSPDLTRARAVPSPDLTQARPVQRAAAPGSPEFGPPTPSPRQVALPSGPGAPSTPDSVGAFHPPTRPRGRGLASRSWLPVVLSFGTVVLVAIALVIYFASR